MLHSGEKKEKKPYITTIHGTPNLERIKAAAETYCRHWIFKEKENEEEKKTEKMG